jgi:hypothetical protein
MLPLQKPGRSATSVFELCIEKIRSPGLKALLQDLIATIDQHSNLYDAAGISSSFHKIPQSTAVGNVSHADLLGVYARMARAKSSGRIVYDEILASAPNGKCPLCAHRDAGTLDHYLPKGHYSLLVVTPHNLVPACHECNHKKLEAVPHIADECILHPYYDNISTFRWLYAELRETTPPAVKFSINPPGHWHANLNARVALHFSLLKLASLYSSQAAEELCNIRSNLILIGQSHGENAVRDFLLAMATSCQMYNLNGWKGATYEAFANSAWFCAGGYALT